MGASKTTKILVLENFRLYGKLCVGNNNNHDNCTVDEAINTIRQNI